MRENGTMKLQEAATAFSEALKGLTREGNLLEWANTQYNLGVTLSRVAERGGETTKRSHRRLWFGRPDACILPNSDRSWPS
jgi:hypothetical protein